MLRCATIFVLVVLMPACSLMSLMPPKSEHVRARQMEEAVVPMAATALETGQLETARRLYRRLLVIDADSVQARMGLGDVAMREQEVEAAARWYASALVRAEQPAERHAALLAHGRAALAAGPIEAARKSFLRLADPQENAPRSSVAWGHNGVGLTLLLEGDLLGGVAAMEQAVLRAPEEERFQGNLDRALAMLREFPPPAAPSGDASATSVEPAADAPIQADAVPDAVPEAAESDGWDVEAVEEAVPVEPEPPANAIEEPQAVQEYADSGADAEEETAPAHSEEITDRNVEDFVGKDLEEFVGEVEAEVEDAAAPEVVEPAENEDEGTEPREDTDFVEPEPPADEVEESEAAEGEAVIESAEVEAQDEFDPLAPAPSGIGEPLDTGTRPVREQVHALTEDGLHYLQFGAFSDRANAEAMVDEIRWRTEQSAQITETETSAGVLLHRVRIGPISSEQTLLEMLAMFEALGYSSANPLPSSTLSALELWLEDNSMDMLLVDEEGEPFLQAGAFSERGTAETLAHELRELTELPVRISVTVQADGPSLHRVRVGPIGADDPLLIRFQSNN